MLLQGAYSCGTLPCSCGAKASSLKPAEAPCLLVIQQICCAHHQVCSSDPGAQDMQAIKAHLHPLDGAAAPPRRVVAGASGLPLVVPPATPPRHNPPWVLLLLLRLGRLWDARLQQMQAKSS